MVAWSPAEDETLRNYIGVQKLSAGRVADLHLPGRTRNAIIGRCLRIGVHLSDKTTGEKPWTELGISVRTYYRLKAADMPLERKRKPPVKRSFVSTALLQPAAAPKIVPEPAPRPNPIPLIELEPHHCRWPFGEGREIVFCGADKIPGRPYCPEHFCMSCS